MVTNRNQLAYQEVAVGNANAIELVVMLYDILAQDLHRAIEAMEAGDIELRSAKLKHGFLALQQLEGSLNMDEGGEMATSMSRYSICEQPSRDTLGSVPMHRRRRCKNGHTQEPPERMQSANVCLRSRARKRCISYALTSGRTRTRR